MILKFYGKERAAILQRLVDEWLPGNVPVAILQGFPGCGKSQLARDVAEKAERSLPPFEPQIDSADPVQDLFLDLAITLEQNDLPRLGQEIDKGAQANFGRALLDTLRSERVLIIVDEFQRFFPKETTTPPGPWRTLVEHLGNSPKPQGRLLLISNRAIKLERWCENCRFDEVKGLTDDEAEALFADLLESSGLGAKVPPERRREIAHRLGGNPRALKTLVASLRTDSLNDLLSAAPDLKKPGDVVLDPRLVEDFERQLLNRVLPKLETDLLKFMRWLSVHRRPFRKEALAQFTGGRETPEALRKQLFDRFLLEQTIGGDVPHPLAREISVNRLRAGQGEWAQAHSLAANYHLRHFKARQPKGASTLVVSYTELRHHLHEAGRISELSEVSERLTQFALSQIHLTTPVPTNQGALEERIALLSALPDDQRPKVLEYHLARCLVKRGKAGDKERALKHARKGAGRHQDATAWLLRLNLEYEFHGIDTVLPVVREALRNAGSDPAPIYQRGAELMAKADRLDDAIKLLEKGIAVPGMTSLSSLYLSCAELMAKADRLDDAITVLEKGIAVPGITNLFYLYLLCAELMDKTNRLDDAIALLEKGIAMVPVGTVVSLYQSCAELMAKANRLDDGITLLEKGIAVVPAKNYLNILFQVAIQLTASLQDTSVAETFATKGFIAVPKRFGRHKIVETALRIFAARDDSEAILRLQGLTGSLQLDPPQQALAEYYLIRLSGDWEKAAESAHQGLADFPNYTPFRVREVDVRLALGQVAKADELMMDHQIRETQTRDNPVVWLKAYVSLIAGHTDEAKSLAGMYAPFDFDSDRPLDEAELMRLWFVARNGMNGPIEANFPGLVDLRRRNTEETELNEKPPIAEPTRQPCVLAMATEWDSHHGGLSTFNRELCLALAQAGHQVACLVPDATAEEVEQARKRGVLLLVARKDAGLEEQARLCQRPELPSDFKPEVILGHDRVTGPAARALQKSFYPEARRIQFIHTSPMEIEWFKDHAAAPGPAATAEAKERVQLDLAKSAHLVMAVGPVLYAEFATMLSGLPHHPPIGQMNPALGEFDLTPRSSPPSIHCLVLGRAEDYPLKGLDIAARAMGLLSAPLAGAVLVVRGAPAGKGEEIRKRLQEDARRPGLTIHAREYTPDSERLKEDLRRASLLLMPSRKEGFGLVGVEAITAGTPVLISEQSGLGRLLQTELGTEAHNFVVPVTGDLENDAVIWNKKMEFVLSDREAAFSRATRLRERLQEVLSWPKAVASLVRMLDDN